MVDEEEDHFVPLPSNPIIYQIHVPTYSQEKFGSLETINVRLETMKLSGINTIELNSIEFLNCDEDKATCWSKHLYSL